MRGATFIKALGSPEIREMDNTKNLSLSLLRTGEVFQASYNIRQAILFLRWPVVKRCYRPKKKGRKEEEEERRRKKTVRDECISRCTPHG
jgi:hypothetical protein